MYHSMKNKTCLRIGILNIMHDKAATIRRIRRVLSQDYPVELTFFYPQTHYTGRQVPAEVAAMMAPLDLSRVKDMDAFLITGAPLEHLAFEDVTYYQEVVDLMEFLATHQIEQFYLCWGAMVASHYFYGSQKHDLSEKVFGVYPQKILRSSPLLTGLADGFLAPHARYAEMDGQAIVAGGAQEIARSQTGHLFLFTHPAKHRTFLFAHLEYGRNALKEEYQREWQAKVAQRTLLARPQHYYLDETNQAQPDFSWEETQRIFFQNWLDLVARRKEEKV